MTVDAGDEVWLPEAEALSRIRSIKQMRSCLTKHKRVHTGHDCKDAD